jgi:hypothetical protein
MGELRRRERAEQSLPRFEPCCLGWPIRRRRARDGFVGGISCRHANSALSYCTVRGSAKTRPIRASDLRSKKFIAKCLSSGTNNHSTAARAAICSARCNSKCRAARRSEEAKNSNKPRTPTRRFDLHHYEKSRLARSLDIQILRQPASSGRRPGADRVFAFGLGGLDRCQPSACPGDHRPSNDHEAKEERS